MSSFCKVQCTWCLVGLVYNFDKTHLGMIHDTYHDACIECLTIKMINLLPFTNSLVSFGKCVSMMYLGNLLAE